MATPMHDNETDHRWGILSDTDAQRCLGLMDAPSQPVETSEDAADAIRPIAGTLRAKVLSWLYDQPDGATQEQIADACDMPRQTVCARVWELEGSGYVVKAGCARRLRSGRMAKVYYLTDSGRHMAFRLYLAA